MEQPTLPVTAKSRFTLSSFWVIFLLFTCSAVSGVLGYFIYPRLHSTPISLLVAQKPVFRKEVNSDPFKNPFCKKYGTFMVKASEMPAGEYAMEGVTAYIKAQGNISYNENQPMFGISAPNSGTGPFIIPDEMEAVFKAIPQGSCVEMIYGSRGFDNQKVIFQIHQQSE